MPPSSLKARVHNARKELATLALAAFASTLVLTVAVVKGDTAAVAGYNLSKVFLFALIAGAMLTAVVMVWGATSTLRRQVARTREENADLRQNLTTAEAITNAEPQILIFWDQGSDLQVVSHTLRGIDGVPLERGELLHFGMWLDGRSADALSTGLDALFGQGQSFNIILKTLTGGHLEADGRAAAGRAVLRLRDVAGYKRDISTILDGQQNLARDIRSGRTLLNALPMPVWLKDTAGQITWVNAAYVRAVEAVNEQEVIDRQIELLEQRQRKATSRALVMGNGFHERLQLNIAGERKAHDVIVLRLDDSIAGAAIDVTAVETVRGELDRQTAAYDRTLDRVATAVAIFNADRKLAFFNDAFRALWGLEAKWLQSGPSDSALLDRLRELSRLPEVVNYREWRGNVLHALDSNDDYEDWWHLPDGRVLHIMAAHRPDGGTTFVYEDETERLNMESRVNAMTRVQSETLDSLKEAVAVFGTDGRLKLVNTAFQIIWNVDDHNTIDGLHVDEVIRILERHYDDQNTWAGIKQAVTALRDQRIPLEGQMLRTDQTVIDYASMPLPDGATLLTFVDVTGTKRYERALIDRNEALEAAAGLKNKFIGHVSYELRTPLTNIIGFSELLYSPVAGTMTEKQREYLDNIASSSTTLLAIIDDILDLATIDAGTLALETAEINVRDMIDTVVRTIEERAARAELTLDIAIDDTIDKFTADEARIRQMLYNLLSNAIGFSPPGSTVSVSCWKLLNEIIFQVEDQGRGIPQEDQDRVFERFESRSGDGEHRGPGLGLSVVKSLVELHGGRMTLQSEPDKGTTVTLYLPLDAAAVLPDTQDPSAEPSSAQSLSRPVFELEQAAEKMRQIATETPPADAEHIPLKTGTDDTSSDTSGDASTGPQVIASGVPPRSR